MTPDEIIRLANEVGYPLVSIGGRPYIPPLLAALLEAAAAAEREACAKVCGELADSPANSEQYRMGANWARELIRARGEK